MNATGPALVTGNRVLDALREIPHVCGVGGVDDSERVTALEEEVVCAQADLVDVQMVFPSLQPLQQNERAQIATRLEILLAPKLRGESSEKK
jgi:hypothetical protein